MRHYPSMKAFLCLSLLVAAYAAAQEPADGVAISRAIAALNEPPPHDRLFTADGNGSSELQRLPKAKAQAFRIREPFIAVVPAIPTVIISHEPWGEARINFPPIEVRAPNSSIVFVTPDVVLAEVSYVYQDDDATRQALPLLFVMKRESGDWKIASVRVLASH